ncbi:hypothetical protein Pmani_013479 [Petrolisthes manimaculis]|uniref:Uncharacterized protein n=1 Tax=Petrolisthes manimaculis TaxID=1843537 RepID=A0AAE1PW05_9EUCA|nr:hypothetical protein Pmani_013479 [Petrolisthes manimaculis]
MFLVYNSLLSSSKPSHNSYHITVIMKSLLLLLFSVALTRTQDEPVCMCRAFVNVEEGQLGVLDFPSNKASSCNAVFECCGFCGGEVYLNCSLCEGPWQFDGQISRQPLCCTAGTYSPC